MKKKIYFNSLLLSLFWSSSDPPQPSKKSLRVSWWIILPSPPTLWRGGREEGRGICHVIRLPQWKHKYEPTAGTTFPTSVTRHSGWVTSSLTGEDLCYVRFGFNVSGLTRIVPLNPKTQHLFSVKLGWGLVSLQFGLFLMHLKPLCVSLK